MSAATARQAGAALAARSDSVRGFRLTVAPGNGDSFGVVLDETFTNAERSLSIPVMVATPGQVARVVDAVFAAVRASGHQASALSGARRRPVGLGEAEGVRLALVLLACRPVTVHSRVREIVSGVAAMSVEETYYWYAKCLGQHGSRALKALRVLLTSSEEHRHG